MDDYSTTGPMPLDHSKPQRRRVIFDPTVNLGTILQIVVLAAAIFSAYATLDKRTTLLEEKQASTDIRLTEQEVRVKESLQEIRQDVKELQRSINTLSQSLIRRQP